MRLMCNCALQVLEFSRVSFSSDCTQKQLGRSGSILPKVAQNHFKLS